MPNSIMDILMAPYHIVGDMIEAGGVFVIWIFLSGLLLWTLTIERYWYFSRVLPKEAEKYLATWRARHDHTSWRARAIRQMLISKLNAGMAANQQLLKTLVPLAPLLGLIGTVSGMLKVFESMALLGSADARTMANGVSEAMICTLTGLAVSITGLYPVYYFNHRTRRETELLADQFEF
jgi:biopolymer transport protein ExbB